MKAIVQDRYGSAQTLRLRDVPEPVAGDGEVLVRVRAASLHPDIWHAVTGRPYVFRLFGSGLLRPKRAIPGTDMAGVVESVGRDVTRFQPGDEVFGETLAVEHLVHGGAFAEVVSVPQENLALNPGNVTFEQAAAVPNSGFIALGNLPPASELGEGRDVLVNGAGGGVGALALQILKAHGARVSCRYLQQELSISTAGTRERPPVILPSGRNFPDLQRESLPESLLLLLMHYSSALSIARSTGRAPENYSSMELILFSPRLPERGRLPPARPIHWP